MLAKQEEQMFWEAHSLFCKQMQLFVNAVNYLVEMVEFRPV
jgi:hypothetical protein